MDNTFLLGFVFSEAAANVPTSAFLVCHGHRCKLPAELQQRLEEERKKEKEKKKRNPHCIWLPFKVLCVYIF